MNFLLASRAYEQGEFAIHLVVRDWGRELCSVVYPMLHAEIGNLLRGRETTRGNRKPGGFGGKIMMDIKCGKWRVGREMKNRSHA